MKILSVLQDHCGIHKNFINIFLKNYYGVYISLNFRFHTKNNLFGFQFNKFVGKSSKIRSLLLNWKGSDLYSYDVTHKFSEGFDPPSPFVSDLAQRARWPSDRSGAWELTF